MKSLELGLDARSRSPGPARCCPNCGADLSRRQSPGRSSSRRQNGHSMAAGGRSPWGEGFGCCPSCALAERNLDKSDAFDGRHRSVQGLKPNKYSAEPCSRASRAAWRRVAPAPNAPWPARSPAPRYAASSCSVARHGTQRRASPSRVEDPISRAAHGGGPPVQQVRVIF